MLSVLSVLCVVCDGTRMRRMERVYTDFFKARRLSTFVCFGMRIDGTR
jgi:hypothetical protein